MKHFYISLIFCFVFSTIYAQQAVVVSGGNIVSSNYDASYSIGQTSQASSISMDGAVLQGVQQPYEIFELAVLNTEGLVQTNSNIKLYPNPVKDYLNLSIPNFKTLNTSYQLFDLSGRLLKTSKIQALKTPIDMNNFPVGSYLLKIQDPSNNYIKTFKIIKN